MQHHLQVPQAGDHCDSFPSSSSTTASKDSSLHNKQQMLARTFCLRKDAAAGAAAATVAGKMCRVMQVEPAITPGFRDGQAAMKVQIHTATYNYLVLGAA